MASSIDVLAALTALERRYDGPIPEPFRQAARSGSAERWLLAEAEGQAGLFAALSAAQIEAIRRARRGGAVPPRLFADLKLYRARQCWWRGEALRMRGVLTRLAADVP